MEYLTRQFELKAVSDTGEFEGYGSVFGVRDRDDDIVMPGAFAETLAEWGRKGNLPYMLWQHDRYEPIGHYIEMREDSHGLFVKGRLWVAEKIEKAIQAHTAMKNRAIDGLSIGFNTKRQSWNNDQTVRKLEAVSLWEISPVTFASNTSAVITMVKGDTLPTIREFENVLRDAGFTRAQAQIIVSKGYRAIQTERDAGKIDDAAKAVERLINQIDKINV